VTSLLDRTAVRRSLMGAAVLVGLGCFVLAGLSADTEPTDAVNVSGDVVERLIPSADFAVLRQNPVGVDLAPGWGVESITVNGRAIPEDQWDVTPELNLYQVRPGPDQVLDELLPTNEVQVVAFELLDPTSTETITWEFTST